MVIYFIVMQSFALLCFIMWWQRWSGKGTAWLQGRGWGWKPLFFLFGGFFFQAGTLASLAFPFGDDMPPIDSDWLRALTVLIWLVACPLILFGTYFWVPRLLLPDWIQERLAAGDPAKTAHPIPEVQHLMTKPQNTRLVPQQYRVANQAHAGHTIGTPSGSIGPEGRLGSGAHLDRGQSNSAGGPQLPVVFQIGLGRWWFGAIVCAISFVVLGAAVLGVPAEIFEDAGGLMPLYRVLALVGLVLVLVAGIYMFRAATRPEHVTISSDGVSTHSWVLNWHEIEDVTIKGDPMSHKGQVQLVVSEPAFDREKTNNRWFSGRPFGMGGLVNKEPIIQMQQGTKAEPIRVAEFIDAMQPEFRNF